MATSCDLYIPDSELDQDNADEAMEKRERLVIFQQIAVATTFEISLQAYYEYDLTEQQTNHLKLIYDTTKSWLLGHIAGHLLDSLENKFMTGRDKKEVAQTLLESFIKQSSTEENKKGLLIKFSGGSNNLPLIETPTQETINQN